MGPSFRQPRRAEASNLVAIVEQGERPQRQGHGHGSNKGHVQSWPERAIRLNMGHVPVHAAPPGTRRERFTKRDTTKYNTPQGQHAEQAEGHTHRPFRCVNSRAISPGSLPGRPMRAMCIADAHDPEGQHRLGPEHVGVAWGSGPPQVLMKSPRLVIWRATSE